MNAVVPETSRSPGPFRVTKTVRFAYVDAAGIVFFPRYFELLNAVVEDWFEHGLGYSFARLLNERRGVPTVHIEADFVSPGRLGETVEFTLEVTHIGQSSFTVAVTGHEGETPRLAIRQTLVLMDVERERAVALPDGMRAAMTRYEKKEN